MDTNKKNREHISALSDDALAEDDVELAGVALRTADGAQAWEVYHLIGDVLRTLETPPLSAGFAARLGERLAAEPLHARRSTAGESETAKTAALAALAASAPSS